jgi:hypothetical protein
MHRLACLPLVVAAACGGTASHDTLGNTGTPRATAGQRVPCPEGPALEAAAGKAWSVDAAPVTATCVAVWSGEPLWLLDGWVDRDASVDLFTALVTPDGAVKSVSSDLELPPGAIMRSGTTYAAVDLDGDGRDELLLEHSYDHGGYSQSSLSAAAIGPDGKLVVSTAPPIALSSDNTAADPDPADAYSCDATHRLVDRPGGGTLIEIEAAPATGTANDSCPAPGRHVYRWDGARLVEAR